MTDQPNTNTPNQPSSRKPHYLALSGGVGGAKLAQGLAQVLTPEQLTIAVNVGDDFEHLGLPIWPDMDTVLYTLAEVADVKQGWGRADESQAVMDELRSLGGPDWFMLGDKDIALHLLRNGLLKQGLTPSDIAGVLCQRLQVAHTVLPVTDQPIRTQVDTDEGLLAFQEYFVGRRAEPTLKSLQFSGSDQAQLSPGVRAALSHPTLAGIILCPSNPYLSIQPMLAIKELRDALVQAKVPVLCVSPIVGGQALKGPAAKIMAELGLEPRATLVADLYQDFIDKVLIDTVDKHLVADDDPRFWVCNTVMRRESNRADLARVCIGQLTPAQKITRA